MENNVENINNCHLHAHFIAIYSSSLPFTLWKQRETSSTISLLLIRTSSDLWFPDNSVYTSGFQIIPYPLIVVVVCAQMRSEFAITLYSPQHCSKA